MLIHVSGPHRAFLREWASNEGRVVKRYFRGKCVIISKTVGDTPKVTINDQYEVAYSLSIGTKIDDRG